MKIWFHTKWTREKFAQWETGFPFSVKHHSSFFLHAPCSSIQKHTRRQRSTKHKFKARISSVFFSPSLFKLRQHTMLNERMLLKTKCLCRIIWMWWQLRQKKRWDKCPLCGWSCSHLLPLCTGPWVKMDRSYFVYVHHHSATMWLRVRAPLCAERKVRNDLRSHIKNR